MKLLNYFRKSVFKSEGETFKTPPMDLTKWLTDTTGAYHWLRGELIRSSGIAEPRFDPFELAALYGANGYHSAALNWKRAATVGQGYEASPALQAWLDRACDHEDDGFEGLLSRWALDVEIFANAFIEINEDQFGTYLFWSPAIKTRVKPPLNGTDDEQFVFFEYRVGARRYVEVVFERYYRGDREGMRQFKLESIHGDSWYGGIPYESAVLPIKLNMSITMLAKSFFDNGFMLDKILLHKGGNLTPEQKESLRNFLSQNFKGVENASKSFLLEIDQGEDFEVKNLNEIPKEASFSELKLANRDEISISHTTPRILLNIAGEKSLGSLTEMATAVDIFKIGFANQRQLKYEKWWRRVLSDAGAPEAESFKLNSIDTSNDLAFAQTLAMLTGNQPIISPQEGRDEWELTKSNSPFNSSQAASFVRICKWLEKGKELL